MVDDELKIIIIEECAELVQAITKTLRFGETEENLERVRQEAADVKVMINLLENVLGDLSTYEESKKEKLQIWSELKLDFYKL